ncbi:MAG: tRNA (guanosine(37)-N1)-methyltransferase TrmD [Christensenellales bacterium]|jgi:tRNA (guanine37-N1)-methyltransferase
MRIRALTLFPDMFSALEHSIIGRAQRSGLVELEYVNIRDHTKDKHRRCDDAPFGGGAGMVMTAQPVCDAIRAAKAEMGGDALCVHLSPRGKPFTQKEAKRLSGHEGLILLCSHYEGLDQRAIDLCVDEEISIGDYVLTGGELPAMVLIDSIVRLLPGVLGSDESVEEESFTAGLLEYPHYTRPAEFEGIKVPEVLVSGHAANIDKWRKEQAEKITRERRPDLLERP